MHLLVRELAWAHAACRKTLPRRTDDEVGPAVSYWQIIVIIDKTFYKRSTNYLLTFGSSMAKTLFYAKNGYFLGNVWKKIQLFIIISGHTALNII